MSAVLNIQSGSDDYTAAFRAKQAEIDAAALTAGRGFNESMSELINLQQKEILRLQAVLRDNTTIPERFAETMAVSSVTDKDGRQRHVLLAIATDRSHWIMENFHPNARPEHCRWARVPNLPQARDEADAPR